MTSPVMMPPLTSFAERLTAVVIGTGGGIGGAFATALAAHPRVGSVIAASRSGQAQNPSSKVTARRVDVTDEASIAAMAEGLDAVDLVIVAVGQLHDDTGLGPEKTFRAIDGGYLARLYAVNTIGPALCAKHLLPRLAKGRKAVFAALSARVGSISDNHLGGWHGYRASKAGLNQILRTCAIELARRSADAAIVGLHPGTVDTGLSKPFQGHVPDGKLFTPDYAAVSLLTVLDGLTPADSGGVFAWDGARVPT